MNKIVVKNLADGKLYTYGPDGFIEAGKIQTKNVIPPEAPPTIITKVPEPTRFHIAVVKMDLAEFCMQKEAFQDTSECAIVFTDIFYTGFYKKRKFFVNATYICENSIDLHYFSRYLDVSRVLSQKTDIIEDENTILINPTHYDKTKYKNVIYTTILGQMPQNDICNAICGTDEKIIYIEDNEADLQLIPTLDFMSMSNDVVYIPRQELSQDNTFRMIFGHLMKSPYIRINSDMYKFVFDYITKMKLFFPVNENFTSYKTKSHDTTTTTTGDILFRQ